MFVCQYVGQKNLNLTGQKFVVQFGDKQVTVGIIPETAADFTRRDGNNSPVRKKTETG